MKDNENLIQETPMQAIRLDYLCENCKGKMRPTDFQPHMDGVQHRCENNDSVAVLNHRYPRIIYREPSPAGA